MLRILPADTPIQLDNVTCLYCGRRLGGAPDRTREHVVARKFVPSGSLHQSWNLIAWACAKCNGNKADLEDELSAITMQPDCHGRLATNDSRLALDAARKAAGARSRRTRKRIGNSLESAEFSLAPAPGIKFIFQMVAPPQAADSRICQLAHYHVQAFFYWLSFDSETAQGGFVPGQFAPVAFAHRADWGNPVARSMLSTMGKWSPCVHALGADGYFGIAIRRAPGDSPLWAWAVEWNCNYRVFGLFGDEQRVLDAKNLLPKLSHQRIEIGPGRTMLIREDTPLAAEDDTLFVLENPASTP